MITGAKARGYSTMTRINPTVGDWYKRPGGGIFEVVALDEDDGTIEIQHFDGTVEEVELDSWGEVVLSTAEAPEDWSGSMDMDRFDTMLDADEAGTQDWADPLDFLDKSE